MTNKNPAPLPHGGGPNRRPKLRGHVLLDLLHDLAVGTLTQRELATKYDRHLTQINGLAKNHADQIQAIRDAGMDRLAGLWSADKSRRVAEYQDGVERLTAPDGEAVDPATERVRQAGLRAIAEELGQLTQVVQATHTVYRVDGVDPTDLT